MDSMNSNNLELENIDLMEGFLENVQEKNAIVQPTKKNDHGEHPSSSNVYSEGESFKSQIRGTGRNLLKRFTIMIGSKKLRFRIVSRPDLNTSNQSENFEPTSLPSRYFCSRCGQTFASNLDFQRHTATQCKHYAERIGTRGAFNIGLGKQFQCNICQKAFSRSNNFKIHMKLHESGQRFFCSICGKWFRNMESLQLHTEECMEESEGSTTLREKLLRYKCNYCDKMFHFRRDRAVHERSHTGEKPYTCGYCGRGFTQSQALTIHIRTHTGEKPYTCEYCNGNFRDVSALRKHEYMKHLNEIQLLSSSSANLGHSNTDKTETDNVEEILVPEQFDTIPIQEEEFDIPEKLNH